MRSGTIAFLLGIVYCQQQPALPSAAWIPLWWLSLTCLALIAVLLRTRLPTPLATPGPSSQGVGASFQSPRCGVNPWSIPCYPRVLRRAFILVLWCVAGLVWAVLRATLVLDTGLPADLEGRNLTVTGVVADIVQPRAHGARFLFDIEQMHLAGRRLASPGRVRLGLYRHRGRLPHALAAGQRWRFVVRLKRPHGYSNPGGFDYEGWLFQHRIRATGYVRVNDALQYLGEARGVGYALQRVRGHLKRALMSALPGGPQRGVILALAIGDRAEIDAAHWTVLMRTGTNHLLAISGLHVGLVAGLAFWLGRWLWSRRAAALLWLPAPKAAALIALLAGTLYAGLAGFSLPTQRAVIMLAVAVLAVWWQRRSSASHTLMLALLAVLVYDPLAVMAPGLWLSFGAVGLIIYAMTGRLARPRGWRAWLRVQAWLGLGLLPLLLGLFQRASLIAPLANLFAVPFVGLLIVPLSLAGTVMLLIWPWAGQHLLWGASGLVGLLWQGLALLAAFPLAQWSGAAPGAWAPGLIMGLALLGVGVLLAPRGLPARWLGAVLLLPLLLPLADRPPPGEARFTLLDVGQGLAAVVETHRHVLVYDTGPRFSAQFDAGRAVVAPYLIYRAYRAIDTLIISHGDNDHRGGARSLLELIPARRVLSSVPGRLAWAGAQACRQGQHWRWDGVDVRILSPPALRGRGNNDSCVLRVQAGTARVLLSGDIEARAETDLLAATPPGRRGGALAADLLVVPHHGSRTSSTAAFVRAVSPRYALYAVGYRNRYHFPHPTVVARYTALGAKQFDTARTGALIFRLGTDGVRPPQRYRVYAQRYWHTQ